MLVVDASLVVELSIDRVGEEASAALSNDGQLVAPALLWSEVPSVLHSMAFGGEISFDLAERGFERFLTGRIEVAERRPDGHAKAAWKVAEEFGWAKTYDAEYVALARELGCRLVTLDGGLRRGADRLGFVLTPSEL